MRKVVIPAALVAFSPLPALALGVEARSLVVESQVLEEKKEIAQAIEKMTKALARNEGDYFLNLRLAGLYSRDKKYKLSVAHYLKAASASPRSLEPLLALSLLHYNLAEFGEAATAGLKVLAIDPASHDGLARTVASLTKLKKFDEALPHARAAVRFYPADPVLLEQKGFLEVTLKKNEARETLKQLLLVAPRNAYARAVLGGAGSRDGGLP